MSWLRVIRLSARLVALAFALAASAALAQAPAPPQETAPLPPVGAPPEGVAPSPPTTQGSGTPDQAPPSPSATPAPSSGPAPSNPPPTTAVARPLSATNQTPPTPPEIAPPRAAMESPAPGEPVSRKTRGSEMSFELGGAFQAGAHFPEATELRTVEEAIDSAFGLGAWVIPRSSWALGIAVERIGLGKDHYATDSRGQTMTTSYVADTLWFGGRFYFSEERPAFYIGLSAGPAFPRVRATGTRVTNTEFTLPPEPFECSATGNLGAGVSASAGAEFDIGDAWSFVSEARGMAHFLGKSTASFDGCAPGPGTAVGGSLRIGFAYRFQI